MAFNLPYVFGANNREVVIKHNHGAYLRVQGQNANGNGATGGFARWNVELLGGNFVRIRSKHTGKCLRLWRGGREIDVAGGNGPFTKFKLHRLGNNSAKLESDRFPGKYIAVNPNRTMKIGLGGQHCVLSFWRQGNAAVKKVIVQPKVQPQVRVINSNNAGPFNLKYAFKQNNTVIIRGNNGKTLRVHPNNLLTADGNGGEGHFARWNVILDGVETIKLQNTHTKKYLAIQQANGGVNVNGSGGKFTQFRYITFSNPNGVKLESVVFRGRYVAIMPNGSVQNGRGGPHCKLMFYRSGGKPVQVQPVQPKVIVQQPVMQQQQPQVIVQPNMQQQMAAQQQMMAAQMKAQQEAMQQQMQQQMEQMRIANENSLNAQKQAMEAEKQRMEQQMAMQQQQLLDAQKKAAMEQQQQQQQMEGMNDVNPPMNPEYVNDATPVYPVLNEKVSQANTNDVIVDEKENENVINSMDSAAAGEVYEWLSKLKMERYHQTFLKNGYDQLDLIGDIEKEDLKEMGVALGHIKVIMAAALTAPYMNKRVKLKSVVYDTFIHEQSNPIKMDNGVRCKLQHNDKVNRPGTVWLFDMLDDEESGTNSYFRLKHVTSGTYLRILGDKKPVDTRSPWELNNCKLMLEKQARGVYYIKEAKNEIYLRFEDKRAFGFNEIKGVEDPDKSCKVELKVV